VSLVFNQEQISARELKPALFELDGISRETVEAHYKLYQGYVNKRNEIYFEHLGGYGGDPDGPMATLVKRDFGDVATWRADLKATGMAGRGWAWTAYDWDEGRLFNYVGDTQNTFPIWNATPLVALDVYEHAYFVDYGTDRAAYIDAFFNNLDWTTVNDWASKYQIPLK
jgi:Fe-Mn family superoxide dismutase